MGEVDVQMLVEVRVQILPVFLVVPDLAATRTDWHNGSQSRQFADVLQHQQNQQFTVVLNWNCRDQHVYLGNFSAADGLHAGNSPGHFPSAEHLADGVPYDAVPTCRGIATAFGGPYCVEAMEDVATTPMENHGRVLPDDAARGGVEVHYAAGLVHDKHGGRHGVEDGAVKAIRGRRGRGSHKGVVLFQPGRSLERRQIAV